MSRPPEAPGSNGGDDSRRTPFRLSLNEKQDDDDMRINRHKLIPGRLVPVTLAVLAALGAGPPASAQLKGITGSGLYDFLIQTNCFALSEQQNTRTPWWVYDDTYPDNRVPLLAAGTAKGIVRTVDLPDQVTFLSSNPAVIKPPPKIQAVGAIGGVPYQQTDVYFTINAPSRPTDVDITAVGSSTSVIGAVASLGQAKRVERGFRVYPPQKIKSAAITPARTTPFGDGEKVRIDVDLAWKIPVATATVVIGQPVYENIHGQKVQARLPEWKFGYDYAENRYLVRPNIDKISFEFVARFPSDAKVERVGPIALNASFVVPVEITTEDYVGCPSLVTNPKTAEVRYRMSKRLDGDLQAKPTLPGPTTTIQQAPSLRPGSSVDGVPAPRDPKPSKPDPEPEKYPRPKPRTYQ